MALPATPHLFSLGHSNQPMEAFLGLLKQHRIDVVVDVRSQPYSKFAAQFDAEPLREAVLGAGLQYLFLGKELGGRPAGDAYYDDEGHVRYDRVAEAPFFRAGLERLTTGAARYRVAMMCSEEDPLGCHRFLLIARELTKQGIAVTHVRGDGSVQTEAELRRAEQLQSGADQGLLFGELAAPWRSVRPIRSPRSLDAATG